MCHSRLKILVYANWASKMKFFCGKNFFHEFFISKMGVKTNLRIIMKNLEADPEKEFLTKSISKPYGRVMVIPPVWELT